MLLGRSTGCHSWSMFPDVCISFGNFHISSHSVYLLNYFVLSGFYWSTFPQWIPVYYPRMPSSYTSHFSLAESRQCFSFWIFYMRRLLLNQDRHRVDRRVFQPKLLIFLDYTVSCQDVSRIASSFEIKIANLWTNASFYRLPIRDNSVDLNRIYFCSTCSFRVSN